VPSERTEVAITVLLQETCYTSSSAQRSITCSASLRRQDGAWAMHGLASNTFGVPHSNHCMEFSRLTFFSWPWNQGSPAKDPTDGSGAPHCTQARQRVSNTTGCSCSCALQWRKVGGCRPSLCALLYMCCGNLTWHQQQSLQQ
jgi:hypothetical protein